MVESIIIRIRPLSTRTRQGHGLTFSACIVTSAIAMLLLAGHVSASSETSSTDTLPYIPTTVLIPGSTAELAVAAGHNASSHDVVYVFSPNGDSLDLLTLNISSTLQASSLAAQTLSSSLPFFDGDTTTSTAFTPSLAVDGTIVVYAGDCESGTDFAIWTYSTSDSSPVWVQHGVSASAGTQAAPFSLGGSLSFSEILYPALSPAMVYSYGGMCPNSSITADASTWQSSATYSNQMLRLSPISGSSGTTSYITQTISNKNSPVAEAGFTLTRLPPSIANISGTVSQSINSVLLGGHTQSAFINMSTAAIFSLPEESWSYVAISAPSSTTESELAKKKDKDARRRSPLPTQVDSRSGHTAVLNEGGTALVILGGWVGNINQAADPQLAVLEMSSTNFGEWTWSIPDNQPSGTGIYGHGAALLPGNVMMVSGGYAISSSNSKTRRDLGTAGDTAMFFNITSLSWSNGYTNPSPSSLPSPAGGMSSEPLSKSTRIGLGVGLGVGLAALVALVAVCFWCWRRRQKRKHLVRDKTVRKLQGGERPLDDEDDDMLEQDDWYTGGLDPYMRNGGSDLGGYESLRAPRNSQGFYPEMAESGSAYPNRPRKPAPRVARGLYQPTGSGGRQNDIHPILEGDEDVDVSMHGAISPDKDEVPNDQDDPFVTPVQTPSALAPGVVPFAQPGQGSNTPSPEQYVMVPPARGQHQEVQDWVSDIDASDALITSRILPHSTTVRHSGGRGGNRGSPSRRASLRDSGQLEEGARTDSNLSDSNFSFIRSDSARSYRRLSAPIYNPATAATTSHDPGAAPGTSGSDSNSSGNTYHTAKSMNALQAEGPSLLLGKPRRIDTDLSYENEGDPLTPGSPSKNKLRRSWFGSLKRVFSAGDSSPASSIREPSPTRSGAESSDYEQPQRPMIGLGSFRGTLLKRKQGRQAWEVHKTGGEHDNGEPSAAAAALAAAAAEGREQHQDDWDIERAVEQRLVQIMFTVPKERLRVVNGDAEIDRDEECVVVVDPMREDGQGGGLGGTDERDEPGESSRFIVVGPEKDGGRHERLKEHDGEDEDDEPGESSRFLIVDPEKKPQKEKEVDERSRTLSEPTSDTGKGKGKAPEFTVLDMLQPQHDARSSGSMSRSPSPPAVVAVAEEIRYQRPKTKVQRTRVQELAEAFEARSRSNSPEKGSRA